ncbi:MAG: hypothetical protein ETSY2_15320, partial [Candidatus Entotheonella gemina]
MPVYQANAVAGGYTRADNPTIAALEAKFRELEDAAATIATASGMAAVSQCLLGLLRSGDRLVAHQTTFAGVHTLLEDFLSHYGIEIVRVDLQDLDQLAQVLKEPAAAVYFETITNPYMEVIDAPAATAITRRAGARVIIDNTMLTPCFFKPLQHGADVVIHSASKYICGHGDALGGLISVNDEVTAEAIRKARRIFGGIMSPANASLLMRGIKTLPMRMERHGANAMRLATFLAHHPQAEQVRYPGLTTSPGHRTAASFLHGFGGVMTFKLPHDLDWERFERALRLCRTGFNFGDAATVVCRYGGGPGRVRVSAGRAR